MATTKNLATVPSTELSNAINLLAEVNGEIVRLPYSLIDEKLVPLEEHMDNENNPHKLDTDDIGAATAQEVQELKTEFSEYKISNDAELAQTKSDLNEETTARENAISTEKAERKAEIAVERERINNLVAPSESALTLDAEVIDARVDDEGITHDCVGDAIRYQTGKIKGKIDSYIINTSSENLLNPKSIEYGIFYKRDNGVLTKGQHEAYCGALIPVVDNITTYTVTGVHYAVQFYDKNLNYIGEREQTTTPFTFNLDGFQNIAFMGISWRYAKHPLSSYMVVTGSDYPTEFIPYKKNLILNEDIGINKTQLKEIYCVGNDKEFRSFTECLKYNKNNANDKIIYVDAGEYDLFAEIGGSEFALSIESGTPWKDCNVIVPPNTEIIGVGRVVFNFLPSNEEIGSVAKSLLSPINIVNGNVKFENITINSTRCRYAIHDDGSSVDENTLHEYYNVNARIINGGIGQVFGGGIGKNVRFKFADCEFVGDTTCFSFHNQNNAYNGSIECNGCAFFTYNEGTRGSIRLGSLSTGDSGKIIDVKLSNCYLSNPLIYHKETENTALTNPYKVIAINCGNITVDDTAYTDMQLKPTIYN